MSNDTPTGTGDPRPSGENAAPPPPPADAPPTGSATPPAAVDTRPKTLAIVALVLAGVGFVMAFIPFVNWIAGFVLLAGFIISLIALIGSRHGGKGLSITALILSVVGWVAAFVMILVSVFWIGGVALTEAIQEQIVEATPVMPEDDAPAEDAGAAEDIVVLDGAFGRYSVAPDTWWYVAVIDNPNEDYIFDYSSIDVEAIGADGTILDIATEYRVILSGQAALVGDFAEVGEAEIVDLNIVLPGAADAVYSPFAETGEFTMGALTATSDEVSTTVTGTVSGDFAEDMELVQVSVVARGPSGQIIGGAWTFIDQLPSIGTAVQFEAVFVEPLPEGTVFEAYASL